MLMIDTAAVVLASLLVHAPDQTPPASQGAAAPATQQAPPRPTPPTRDPRSPGYVEATELADGAVPPSDKDENFIMGPTHEPAPEMTVSEGTPRGTVHTFTMNSTDSKYQFVFTRNAAHCDRSVKQQTLPAALEWLWKGYQPAR
jgi:hypothetical protein